MATPKQIETIKKFVKKNWIWGSYTDRELKEMSVPDASEIIKKGVEAIKQHKQMYYDALSEDEVFPDLGCK